MSKNPEDPVVVGAFMDEMEARLIAQELEARGVPAGTLGHMTAGFRAEAPGMAKLIVPQRHEERARAIMQELLSEPIEVDWSGVDFDATDDEPFEDDADADAEDAQ